MSDQILFVIHSSSLLCSGHQSRNVRVKKRGAISSAWLEKYKPEIPQDTDNSNLHSENLVENKSDSVNIFDDEKMLTTEKKSLNRENNTLLTAVQSEISCVSDSDKDTFEKSTVEVRNSSKKKNPEINFKTNDLGSPEEDRTCKMDDKTEANFSSKSKERKEKKYSNKDPNLVSDRHEASRRSCASSSDCAADAFVTNDREEVMEQGCASICRSDLAFDPIVSNESERDMEWVQFEDSRDSFQQVIRNKRKVDKEAAELEKPPKKLRCDNDHEDDNCEESNM